MIDLRGLRHSFHGGPAVLDDVDLSVPRGEIYGVVGASGAGKSTLLRTVNLLVRPDAGTVTVDGQELTALRPAALRAARRRIGMIFQHFHLLSGRSAAANVALPLEIAGVRRQTRSTRVAAFLDLVGLTDKANAYPAQLSGGQRQRVAIARALAAEPSVLLSDEATSALDPHTTASTLDLLRDLSVRLGLTVLLVTHDQSAVARICDSVAVLDAGRVVEHGRVAELLARPDSALSALKVAVSTPAPPAPAVAA